MLATGAVEALSHGKGVDVVLDEHGKVELTAQRGADGNLRPPELGALDDAVALAIDAAGNPDANAEKGVKVIGVFPEDSRPPIIYPVAQTASSKDAETPAFLKCMQSAKAKELFEEQGFLVLAN